MDSYTEVFHVFLRVQKKYENVSHNFSENCHTYSKGPRWMAFNQMDRRLNRDILDTSHFGLVEFKIFGRYVLSRVHKKTAPWLRLRLMLHEVLYTGCQSSMFNNFIYLLSFLFCNLFWPLLFLYTNFWMFIIYFVFKVLCYLLLFCVFYHVGLVSKL